MDVRVKKLVAEAVIPQYAHDSDAGLDMVAVSVSTDEYGNVVFGTGLAVEIPDGYVGLLYPRSSNAKYDVLPTNCVGVIDSGYRGEVMFKYARYRWHNISNEYHVGDRIGQLIIMPYSKVNLVEADELSVSDRGCGGYGSTGK